MNLSHACRSACLLAGILVAAKAFAAPRFHDALTIGADSGEVKVADAIERGDGHWMTFGSHVSMVDNREVAFVSLRNASGRHLDTVELVPEGGLSHLPQTMIELADGDVLLSAVEYDHQDFSAYRGLVLWRLDATLGVTWSTRIGVGDGTVESGRLAQLPCPGCGASEMRVVVFGHAQREVDGVLDAGDGFIATVDTATGALSEVSTLGTTASSERIADVRKVPNYTYLLLEVSTRVPPVSFTSGDGLIVLEDKTGDIVYAGYIDHPTGGGVRSRAMALLPLGDDWVIAGRRTAFGPNFFYLHRLRDTLVPDSERVLLPFFNASDVDADANGLWLYGEANGESMETGTVLMNFDASLQMRLQRRYATDTTPFPTGALALGDGGALLALGANRSGEEVLVYESVHRVNLPSGEGVLCNEGDYDGFTPATDPSQESSGWLPERAALVLSSEPVATSTQTPYRETVPMCAGTDDQIFVDGFEKIEKALALP